MLLLMRVLQLVLVMGEEGGLSGDLKIFVLPGRTFALACNRHIRARVVSGNSLRASGANQYVTCEREIPSCYMPSAFTEPTPCEPTHVEGGEWGREWAGVGRGRCILLLELPFVLARQHRCKTLESHSHHL